MAPKFTFASSWWGEAWVDALEGSARLDPNRLGRGRSYARRGNVGPLMSDPGRVRARVAGSHGRHYQTEIEVRRIADGKWVGVVDALAAKSAHAAALADGELDPAVVDDVRAAGVELLPGPGDLRFHCTCPDWAEPCKHAAALCYLVAAELDRDPFLLFLLRGLQRDTLVAMLRERRGRGGDGDAAATLGVPAADAWEGHELDDPPSTVPSLPARLARRVAPPARPGHPPPWDVRITAPDRVDPRRVDELAVDAAERAWLMLVDGAPSGLEGSPRGDIARRAAAAPPGELSALSARTHLPPTALSAWAAAWRLGGDEAVDVVADEDSWAIDQHRLAGGRDLLVDMGFAKRSVALNYDSLGMPKGVKLVVGGDGRWYHLQAKPGPRGTRDQLHLVGPPSFDIADVIDAPD